MAQALTIAAEARDPAKNQGTGTRVSRRLRARGRIPAIIYGHKQAPAPISLARDDVLLMIKKSTHLAELKIGDLTEMAMVKAVQWDHLGREILHLDFARVSAEESIETEVTLVLHGVAPGVAEGGILEHVLHSLRVKCRATAIPETIRVEISGLHLGQGLHVRELPMPDGVESAAETDQLVVHVVARAAAVEPAAGAETVEQPELIRRPEDKEKEEK